MATKCKSNFWFSLLILGVFLAGGASISLGAGEPGKNAPIQGALDGKTFTVETGEKEKSASEKDDLTFRGGKFRSSACDKYGFGDGAYTTTEKDGAVYFEAETTSPSKGKMHWKGTVRGDKIEVTYTWIDSSHWYKPNPKPLEKWGRGEVKKP